jgi:transposase
MNKSRTLITFGTASVAFTNRIPLLMATKPMDMEKEQEIADPVPDSDLLLVEPARMSWIRMYEQTADVKAVCSRFGISKKTFYKWLKRYRSSNGDCASLENRSRRPHTSPNATPDHVVFLLLKAREQTGFGQRRLRAYLAANHDILLSERTIWKILRRRNGTHE